MDGGSGNGGVLYRRGVVSRRMWEEEGEARGENGGSRRGEEGGCSRKKKLKLSDLL